MNIISFLKHSKSIYEVKRNYNAKKLYFNIHGMAVSDQLGEDRVIPFKTWVYYITVQYL